MADTIIIDKIINGYVVKTSWAGQKDNTVYFENMKQLAKYLDDCFVKPIKDLTYVTKIVDKD